MKLTENDKIALAAMIRRKRCDILPDSFYPNPLCTEAMAYRAGFNDAMAIIEHYLIDNNERFNREYNVAIKPRQ